MNGALTTDDCLLSDGSYYDAYRFSGTAGQQVAVSLSSSAFDTYLYLLNPDGSVLSTDDDGGGNLNSYIPTAGGFITLPSTGTYTIRANSFLSNQTGNYTLSLIGPSGGGCPSTTITVGQTLGGALSTTSSLIPARATEPMLIFIASAGRRANRSPSLSHPVPLTLIFICSTRTVVYLLKMMTGAATSTLIFRPQAAIWPCQPLACTPSTPLLSVRTRLALTR